MSRSLKPGQLIKLLEQSDKTINTLQTQADLNQEKIEELSAQMAAMRLKDQRKIDDLSAQLADMTQERNMAVAAGQGAVEIVLDLKVRQGLVGLRATISRLLAPDMDWTQMRKTCIFELWKHADPENRTRVSKDFFEGDSCLGRLLRSCPPSIDPIYVAFPSSDSFLLNYQCPRKGAT